MPVTVRGTDILFNDGSTQSTAAQTVAQGVRGQVFTTSGSFTVPANVTAVKVTVIGGGGGGGGVAGAPGYPRVAGGGGAGGTAIRYITGLTPGAVISVTVGSNGIGAPGATGFSGGISSFGTYCSATGGSGGLSGGTPAAFTSSIGGSGGAGAGGDINYSGGSGGVGNLSYSGCFGVSSNLISGPGGGTLGAPPFFSSVRNDSALNIDSPGWAVYPTGFNGGPGLFGQGAPSRAGSSGSGSNATGYGNGGSGALTVGNPSDSFAGGAGSPGVVVVEW